jgi:hypothetical protein
MPRCSVAALSATPMRFRSSANELKIHVAAIAFRIAVYGLGPPVP